MARRVARLRLPNPEPGCCPHSVGRQGKTPHAARRRTGICLKHRAHAPPANTTTGITDEPTLARYRRPSAVRPRARWHGVLALCFGAVAAGVFYYFLRGTGSRAPLALILNGNTEAGAAKLAAYAFIAGGIQSFLMRLSPRLGFMALLCSTLTLLGVLVAWNLLPRIADGCPMPARRSAAGAGRPHLCGLASRRPSGRPGPRGRHRLAGHQRAGPVAGGLRWCCARWFLNPAPPGAGGPPTTRNTDPDEIRRCILALRGRLSRRPA